MALLLIGKKADAQEERGYLSFKGETYLNNKHLNQAQIKVFRNGRLFTQTSSSKKGRFELKLEYFHQYKVELYAEGCYKMFIDVNTDIPRDLLPHWATFVIKVPFFNLKDTTVDASLFKQSITNVLFDESRKKFTDQNQFKTNSPATVSIPFINTKPITETPVKVNNAEKKEVLKQDAKENIALKRKEETALIRKVKSNHKTEVPNNSHNKTEWNSTLQKNNFVEKNNVIKKESKDNLIVAETETADLIKKKATSNNQKHIETKIITEEDKGVFENKHITKVLKNNVIFLEFMWVENTFTGNSYFINNKPVNTTEYYLKIKQYIK